MAELIVVGFQGTHRAAEVLEQVQRVNADALIELTDAIAVYRTRGGRIRIDRSVFPTTHTETVSGAILGAIIGATLALPLAALVAVPAAVGGLSIAGATIGGTGGAVMAFDESTSWRESFGISDEFVRDVGAMVQSGQSALFVLASASDPAAVAEVFRGYGGTVLRTTLRDEDARKLQQVIATQAEPVVR